MQENYYSEKDTVADVITLMMIYALVNCILRATESCIITTLLLWKCTAKISPKSLLPFSNLRAYYSWLCKTNCICRRTYYVNVCQVKYTIFMYIVLTKLLKREQIIIGNRKYGFWIYCHTWWKVTLTENYSKLRETLVQQITCVKSNYILNRDLFC